MGTLKNKWGPNGDPKSEKGPHGDPGSQMGTHLGAVQFVNNTYETGQTKIDIGPKRLLAKWREKKQL